MSKKTREKSEFESTRVYLVSNSQIPQIRKEKKLFQTNDFSQQNQKKRKKLRRSKKDTEMYNKEDC